MATVGKEWDNQLTQTGGPSGPNTRAQFKRMLRTEYIRTVVRDGGAKSGARILEAGCGTGKLGVCLATLGYKVTLLDFSDEALRQSRSTRDCAEKWYGSLDVKFIKGDLEKLDLEPTFDLVFNEGVIEHWLGDEARQEVIRQMASATRPGGTVMAFVPNGVHPLMSMWKRFRYPGYFDNVPMINYNAGKLERDFQAAGLTDIHTRGIDPWRSLCQWPAWLPLRAMAWFLRRCVPFPPWMRLRWGRDLVCRAVRP